MRLLSLGTVCIAVVCLLWSCGDKEPQQPPPQEQASGSTVPKDLAPAPDRTPQAQGVTTRPEPSPQILAEEAPLPTIAALPSPRGIADSPKGLHNGDFAPELFHLDMATGKRFRLSDWTGPEATKHEGALVVGFTASWCGPCKQSYSYLKKMEEQFGEDLKVVLVTTDATVRDKEKHLDVVRKSGLAVPLLDPDPDTLRAWLGRRRNIPHFYVINRSGEILVQDRGFGKKVRKVLPGQIKYAIRNPDYVVRR